MKEQKPTATYVETEKRKVIQISASDYLYALCNDGTIWVRKCGEWYPTQPIPQEKCIKNKDCCCNK